MRRIALLGNSHLAAWKLGWEEISTEFSSVELTFFAANGDRLSDFRPDGDRLLIEDESVASLVQLTSGGKREIVVADYDAFCIVGLKFGIGVVSALYSHWRSDSHRGNKGRFALISDDCYLCTAIDILTETPAMDLARKLQSLTDKPLLLGVQPAPSEDIVKLRSNSYMLAIDASDDSLLRATYQSALTTLAKGNLTILDQPPSTLASPLLSKHTFQRGRTHVADLTHLNAAYGAIALTDMLSQLGVPRSPA